jgi:hypothetical protein
MSVPRAEDAVGLAVPVVAFLPDGDCPRKVMSGQMKSTAAGDGPGTLSPARVGPSEMSFAKLL